MLHGNISKLNCVPGFNHGRGTGKISLEGSKLQWTCMLILHVLGPLNWLHGAILFFTFLDEECKKSEIPGISKCISYHHSGRNKKNIYIFFLQWENNLILPACLYLTSLSSKWMDVVWSLWQYFPVHPFGTCVDVLGLTHPDNGASDPLYTARTRWEKLTRRNVESVRIKSSEAFPFPVFSMLEIVPYSNRN